METTTQFANTLDGVRKSTVRIKKYVSLIPLVDEERQSQFLHNIYEEADTLYELYKEILKGE